MRCNSDNTTAHRSKVLLVIGLVMTLLVLQAPAQQETDSPGAQSTNFAIQDEAQAIARARQLVGLPDRTAMSDAMESPIRAVMVMPEKDNTPYLSDRIAGRQIWRVEFENVRLKLSSAPQGSEDLFERTFDVYLDADGGLLKIQSQWPEGESSIPPEPDAETTTDQFLRSGEEVYHAFPDEPPPISFVEALDGLARGIGNPLIAKQIKAQYVLWSKLDWEPRPMWVITLRGIPPFKASYPGVSVHARDHLRFIVDPETGQWVQALSTPQPVISEDERQAFAGGIPAGTVQLSLFSPADGQNNVTAGQVITWQIEAAVSDLDPFGLSMFSVDLVQDSTSPTPNPNLIDIPRGDEPGPLDDMAGFNRPAGISNPGPDGYGSGYGGTQIGLFGQKNLRQIGGGQNTFGVSGGAVGQDIVVETDIGKGGALELLAAGDFLAPCTPGTYTYSIENGVAYLLDVHNVTDNYWEVKQATVDNWERVPGCQARAPSRTDS